MKRREAIRLSVVTGAALSGCLGNGSAGESSEPRVSVTKRGYDPRNLSVDGGATVTWVNENSTPLPEHTVTSEPFLERSAEWSFDEKLEEEGDEVSYTFEEDGLYTYVGTVKGESCMCGLVAVGDASYGDPLPCAPVAGGGC